MERALPQISIKDNNAINIIDKKYSNITKETQLCHNHDSYNRCLISRTSNEISTLTTFSFSFHVVLRVLYNVMVLPYKHYIM